MATAKKANKPEGDAAGETKPKKKKTLILAVLGLLVAGAIGGGAAWYFAGQQAPADSLANTQPPPPPQPPVFSALDSFVVNLQPEMGEQYLQVTMTLQLAAQEQADQIKTYMPMIRSRLLALLSSKRPSELTSTEGKNKLAEDIIATLNEPFASGAPSLGVTSVFFTAFVIQ